MPVGTDIYSPGNQYTSGEAAAVAQAINGSGYLAPVHAATNTETLTIASGSVTTIALTTVDGVTIAAGDRILIPNAPASTGAAGGTTLSTQPANGVYTATAVATNISVSRVFEMGGNPVGGGEPVYNPSGWTVSVTAGTVWDNQTFMVGNPSNPAATMVYGTTSIMFVAEPNLTNAVILTNKQLTGPLLTSDASPTYAAGKMVFDSVNDCITFFNSDSNVSLQIGQEDWIRVINSTGSTITNGQAVYINGNSGVLPTIALARANAATTCRAIGIATESIANTATGICTTYGLVHGLNTSGFTAGVPLYLDSTTAGNIVATSPVAPNFSQQIGWCGVSSATVGIIIVNPATPTTAVVTASGKLLTVNNNITLAAGADGQTFTFPSTSGTVVTQGSVLGTPLTGTLTNCTGLPNAGLTNSSLTIGSTSVALGATAATVAGLTLTSPVLNTVGTYTETVQAMGQVTAATHAIPALSGGTMYTCQLPTSGAVTFTMPTAAAGASFMFDLKQAASGLTATVAWTTVIWPGAVVPVPTATLNYHDVYAFFCFDGTNWRGSVAQGYSA